MKGVSGLKFLDKKILDKIGFNYVIDNLCISSVFGRDILKNIEPIADKEQLLDEYVSVEKFISIAKSDKLYYNFTDLLKRFKDIRNTFKRIKNGEILDEVELFEVKNYAVLFGEFKKLYETANINVEKIIINDFYEVFSLLNPQKTQITSFYIYEEYSEKLKIIRENKKNIEYRIYREKENAEKLLKERSFIVNEEKAEEFEVRKELSCKLRIFAEPLLESTLCVGKIDILIAKAKLAVSYNMCKPSIKDEIKLKIKNGVNPMARAEVLKKNGRFYPISLEVFSGSAVITGANMGGKTVALSIAALNYLLAHMGFYVFCEEFEFYPLDFMYFLSEDGQSMQSGLSTFGSEVLQLKNILNDIKSKNGLVILDEFARGTNPAEGNRLTKGLVKYLNKFSSISILATHYDGPAKYAKVHYQVTGLKNVDFEQLKKFETNEESFLMQINRLMDYTVEKVGKETEVPKDALKICSLIGIDKEIIELAQKEHNSINGYCAPQRNTRRNFR